MVRGTSHRARCRLARSIERAVRERRPAGAAIPVDAAEVAPVAGDLLLIAAVLRSEVPVQERGLRQLRRLLTDGAGPLFYPRWRGELARRVRQATAALVQPPASTTS